MYLICGLGNPGKQYEMTRHNMGFRALDVLSSRLDIPIRSLKFKALYGEGRIGTEKVILLKPQTFMNLSGESLREAVAFYKIPSDHVIVIYDDIDLPVGQLRIREKGSAGTHNGMKSVIYQLQTDVFPRIRIGLGSRGQIPLVDFVMGKPTDEDEKLIKPAIKNAADAAETIIRNGVAAAQQIYNVK